MTAPKISAQEMSRPTCGVDLSSFDLLNLPCCVVGRDGEISQDNKAFRALGLAEAWALLQGNKATALKLREAVEAARQGMGARLESLAIDHPPGSGRRLVPVVMPGEVAGGGVMLVLQEVEDDLSLRRQFERILDSTPDGIFVIDAGKRLRMFNKSCGEITGRNPAEILTSGCSCSDVIECHTEDGQSYATSLCPAKAVFRGEMSHQREEMLLTNSAGEERWVETMYSPVKNGRGEVEYVIGVLRDVHDRKLLEEKLNQSEKLASLGQLVAGIAHEIKNPLAIILSSLDIVENMNRPAEQRREAAMFLREEVKRLDGRLRSFLAFARPRNPQLKPMVLSGLIQRRVASMAPLFPEIEFHVDIRKPEPILMADEEQVNQVLTNLLLNAGEAIEGGGSIIVTAQQAGDKVVVEVEDSGPGIPEEFRARIFDPFFTTKTGGTGLGLSICYQIVLSHGGTISVSRGRGGRGTCFAIRLPGRSAVGVSRDE